MNFMGRGEGSGYGTTKSYMLVWKFRTTTFLTCSFFVFGLLLFVRKKEQAIYEMDVG